MRLYLSAIAAVICLTIGGLVAATLIPDAPVTRVETVASVAVTAPAQTTTTSIDWRPGAIYATRLARAHAAHDRMVAAIRYTAALAEQDQLARRLVTQNHETGVPTAPAWKPTWSSDRWSCPSLAGAFTAIWGARAHWADRTAKGESGCSVAARNPRTCDPAGRLHAIGVMQQCGYSGPLDVWSELRAAWSLCLVQRNAWSYHGACR